jgi:hypothetical protein
MASTSIPGLCKKAPSEGAHAWGYEAGQTTIWTMSNDLPRFEKNSQQAGGDDRSARRQLPSTKRRIADSRRSADPCVHQAAARSA